MKLKQWSQILGLVAVSAVANTSDPYFDIKEVQVKETIESVVPVEFQQQIKIPQHKPFFDESTMVILDQVVNLGQKAWNIVQAGKPVMNVNMITASALPQGVQGWDALNGWQNPVSRHFKVQAKNGFGSTVVNFAYRIVYTAGGNYKGVGRYIAQIATLPAEVDVVWGYKFDAQTLVPHVVNVGSEAAPVAGAETTIQWEINTPLKQSKHTDSYFIRGDGQFVNLNRDN